MIEQENSRRVVTPGENGLNRYNSIDSVTSEHVFFFSPLR